MIESILNDFYCCLGKKTNPSFANSLKDLIESGELDEKKLSDLIEKEVSE